ncbi:MAG: hypothetical protein ACREOD_09905 [Candidatus Dormibacteria bacterium]
MKSAGLLGADDERGVAEATNRLRQTVDGIESAIAAGDDLELARYLASPALGQLLAVTAAFRAKRATWLPARSGLRWTESRRPPEAAGRFWLTVRFEDRTQALSAGDRQTAPLLSHQLELELDTSRTPWRLCQVVTLPLD